MPGFLSPRKGVPLLLIPEYSGINKGQRVPDRSKTAHSKPLVKCFLTNIGSKIWHTLNRILEKAAEPEIKLPTSAGSLRKQQSSRKTSISALLTMPKPLTVWITINCGKFWEMGIPDLTHLLRNLYAGQEATVRTGHGTTDWFQIGKVVRQGCILSPCLFNLYAEYIMRNTGLEEDKLESRLLGEISIISDMQMIPSLWQKVKRN